MTCPNCYCSACQAERSKWTQPPNWLNPVPVWPAISPPIPMPGYWACSCGQVHPPGFCCTQITYTAGKPGDIR